MDDKTLYLVSLTMTLIAETYTTFLINNSLQDSLRSRQTYYRETIKERIEKPLEDADAQLMVMSRLMDLFQNPFGAQTVDKI